MRPSRQLTCLIATVILACAGAATAAEEPTNESGRVDRLFAEWDKPTSPGCAVGVMKDGRILYERG